MPALPVKAAALPVKAPALPVKAPALPVKASSIPVKAPTLPVNPPPLPVKAPPIPVPTVPLKTPPVPVKTPTVPVKVPALPVNTPAPPGKTPALPVKAPPAVKAPAVPSHGAPRGGSVLPLPSSPVKGSRPAGGALPSPGGAGTGTALAGLPGRAPNRAAGSRTRGATTPATTGRGSAGVQSFQALPASAGSALPLGGATQPYGAGPQAVREIAHLVGRHKAAPNAARLRGIVEALRGCLPLLNGKLGELLRLRTGLGGQRPLGVRSVARRLHVPSGRVPGLEIAALRRLRLEAETTGCARVQSAPATLAATAPVFGGFVPVADLSAPLATPHGGVAGAFYLKPSATAEAPESAIKREAPKDAGTLPVGQGQLHGGSSALFIAVLVLGVIVLTGLLASESVGGALLTRRRRRRR